MIRLFLILLMACTPPLPPQMAHWRTDCDQTPDANVLVCHDFQDNLWLCQGTDWSGWSCSRLSPIEPE